MTKETTVVDVKVFLFFMEVWVVLVKGILLKNDTENLRPKGLSRLESHQRFQRKMWDPFQPKYLRFYLESLVVRVILK